MFRAGCLLLARFCTSAWIGAAALFVVNGVHEVTSPLLDSTTKDQLALIRFPAYYWFGFPLVITSLLTTLLAGRVVLGTARRTLSVVLLAAALSLMTYDFVAVYTPLRAMLNPPGQVRTAEFQTLHMRSRSINTAHVGLVFCAALLLCWEGVESGERRDGERKTG